MRIRRRRSADADNAERSKEMTESIDRFLRLDEVLHATGLGRNTIYRRIREGTFPKTSKNRSQLSRLARVGNC